MKSQDSSRLDRSRKTVPFWKGVGKGLIWKGFHVLVAAGRIVARIGRGERRVDTIIYKVDRLGDWLFAEKSIERIIDSARQKNRTCVVWASRESAGLREWRPANCPIETLVFEPQGWMARLVRTFTVLRLLAFYRCDTFYCLRHGPDPVRDFVLRNVAAQKVHALTWRISPGEPDRVPHEIRRHFEILAGAGLAPRDPAELLPCFSSPAPGPNGCVVIAPFSSTPIKDWKFSAWCDVVKGFSDRTQNWELWVSPDQLPRARELAAQLSSAIGADVNVSVRSGRLVDLVAAIRSARLVLSVDTVAAHIASALDVRMVGILGGGQYGDFAPWSRSSRQRWVTHPLPCYNCGWHCNRSQPDCIQLITPGMVIAAMQSVWQSEDKDRGASLVNAGHPRWASDSIGVLGGSTLPDAR